MDYLAADAALAAFLAAFFSVCVFPTCLVADAPVAGVAGVAVVGALGVAGAWANDTTAAVESKTVAIMDLILDMVNSLIKQQSLKLRPS